MPLIPALTAAIHLAKGHLTRAAEALGLTRVKLKTIISICPHLQGELEQAIETPVTTPKQCCGAGHQGPQALGHLLCAEKL
jgi:hypothetical protein